MTIALLCPTRGRPANFNRMWASVSATAKSLIRVHAVSNGDDDYVRQTSRDMPTVMMWNKLAEDARKTDAKLFMLCADDVIFSTPNWDEALLDHYNKLDNKIHVYALQDSRDDDGTPHIFVTREYMDAMGYFLPPIFLHWFVDTWTVEIAKANGVFTHLRNYRLIHDKPSDRGQPDDTHSRIRQNGWHERDKYVNDTCQHFLAHEKARLATHMKAPAMYGLMSEMA